MSDDTNQKNDRSLRDGSQGDTRTTIPTLRKATKSLEKSAYAELNFAPNDLQARTKAKFYRRLEEMSHIIDRESAFASEKLMTELAGTPRIIKWLEDPAFASWFVDEEFVIDTISSLQQKAVQIVHDVLVSSDASEGDRLKAARMLLELGDQFPGRKSEVRFLDDRINELSDTETDKEIKRLRSQLDRIGEDDE